MSKETIKMAEYERGVRDCIPGKACDYNGNPDYIDGYADQYAKEQLEYEHLTLNYDEV